MKYFKQTMGVSFTSYLNTYRLTMAARLLLQSDDTVLSIATEVGFDNLSYFNRVFKKQYHTTPSEFRRGKR
jgi:AraC-like DNA-binding protein